MEKQTLTGEEHENVSKTAAAKQLALLSCIPLPEVVRSYVASNRRIEAWSDDDVAHLLGEHNVKQFLTLPLHLQNAPVIIGCWSHNWFNAVFVPGTLKPMLCPPSSIIALSGSEGAMNMGWGSNNLVSADGHFLSGPNYPNSWPQPANNKFLVDPPNGTFNRYCFAVRVGSLILGNPNITSFGASVGSPGAYWAIGANQGGQIDTGFNDEDDNNSGTFSQTMTITAVSVAIALKANSMDQELREAVMDLLPADLRRK